MATFTISPDDDVYSVSPDPVEVPKVGKLSIVAPTEPPVGCLICLDSDLDGARPYVLTSNRDFDLRGKARGTIWGYGALAPTATCPTVNKRNAAHPIQVICSR
jgi:hypothetical protein